MTTGPISVPHVIQNAAQALQCGDKRAARYWAQLAVSAAPGSEEPWLILAAVSGPRAGIEYLKQALLVNPGSERAMRGLSWAQARLAKQAAQQPRPQRAAVAMSATQPVVSATRPIPTQPLQTQPMRVSPQPVKPVRGPAPQQKPDIRPGRVNPIVKKLSMPALLLTFICIVAAWSVWPGSTSSALALIHSEADSGSNGPAWSLAEIAKPTRTPTVTPTTVFPTAAATTTPAPTDASSPTPLPTDESVVSPTDIPPTASVPIVGTYTVQSGDTLSNIAQRAGISTSALAAANQISTYTTIYPGQVLGIPQGGSIPDPATQPPPDSAPPAQYGEKYILVDISEQHLYTYEGDTLIYSFVASTGMNNATSVGVFHVQDKIPNAYGATWDLWMPNWLGIYYAGGLENGIHALPILSNGSRLWAGYLGTPISFGCVVLGIAEAQQLYDWADVGTTVEIRR